MHSSYHPRNSSKFIIKTQQNNNLNKQKNKKKLISFSKQFDEILTAPVHVDRPTREN